MTNLRMITAGLMLIAAGGCAGPSEGTPGNPPGTAAERAVDRVAGTNNSGAYPAQSDGRPGNLPGTSISRGIDRAMD